MALITRFGVELVAPLPAFGAAPGDRLVVRVGHKEAIVLCRPLPPNHGAVAEALEQGLAQPLNPENGVEDLLVALRLARAGKTGQLIASAVRADLRPACVTTVNPRSKPVAASRRSPTRITRGPLALVVATPRRRPSKARRRA